MPIQQDISVERALSIVLGDVAILPSEMAPLHDVLGRVLAAPVIARESLPPFANSSMDGFALRASDVSQATPDRPVTLNVVGEVAAGAPYEGVVGPGEAVRITTGAPVPRGADAVVPVEDTGQARHEVLGALPEMIRVARSLATGDYIRLPGEDVQAGDTVLSAGVVIRPQEIGLMASLGYASVAVIRRPRVGVLATGDELVGVNDDLTPGKIRNSNGYAQAAQVTLAGGEPVLLGVARDTVLDLRERLHQGLEAGVDVFVSSAGVSVGAYDVVTHILREEGVVGFWRVRMRPGKPLTFGHYRNTPYFGLPGNPVSAMVSFERFVRPALLKMGGHTKLTRPQVPVTVTRRVRSDGRESYVRAVVEKVNGEYSAAPTGRQGSHMMTSLARANALIIIPEGVREVSAGSELTAIMIDWPVTVF
ncbi:MAG: molybdopterin molybdotransferase MoeA [Chloroflexota bacterium]|jgi:molybdopterin molybdotransferase